MMVLLAMFRNWRNRQVFNVLRLMPITHQCQESDTQYVPCEQDLKETNSALILSLDLKLIHHRFYIGSMRSFKTELHMGEVVATKRYLDASMRLQNETKRFYALSQKDFHRLLSRWIPCSNGLYAIDANNRSNGDRSRSPPSLNKR